MRSKLLFHLCSTCAAERNPDVCTHSDDKRQFWGSWPTCELYKALEMGYKILELAEVYHYDTFEVYDPANPTSGLFTDYINSFLKTKQEVGQLEYQYYLYNTYTYIIY